MNRVLSLLPRIAVTAAVVAVACVVGLALWNYYMEAPWTRDGHVRADVVTVAPDVSGLVTEVLVEDNQEVKRGDLLFRIDPERFQLALRQAEALVQGRLVTAKQQALDDERYAKLSGGIVSDQKVEQARALHLSAQAAYEQAVADRDLARLNLARSEVHAAVNGRITNLDLRPGTYVQAGRGVVALVDTDTIRVEGYFEETKLSRIKPGAAARISLLGDSGTIAGRVESIAAGVADRERTAASNLLANVSPTFAWVRLAQRIPVRIAVDIPKDDPRLIPGRTATVSIEPPAGDRPLGFSWMGW
ncbi:HlyD family secretion protein [Enterovirga sp.]|uniref:HlyD family secretion protein n=1 Tax=Enterovirga sp. TaxID=2026350 RepID=UPI002C52B2D9|nr:HlyD family secretion protein [Enterovirga sp.]HMO28650.1 HlyD family secretion protein [Enterovirga sp.]